MIRGMSSEKPALVLLRRIETAWSLYEMMGDITMKMGATTAVVSVTNPIVGKVVRRPWTASRCSGGSGERRTEGRQRREAMCVSGCATGVSWARCSAGDGRSWTRARIGVLGCLLASTYMRALPKDAEKKCVPSRWSRQRLGWTRCPLWRSGAHARVNAVADIGSNGQARAGAESDKCQGPA